jgi:hypothetical protein
MVNRRNGRSAAQRASAAAKARRDRAAFGYKGLGVGSVVGPKMIEADETVAGPFKNLYDMFANLGEDVFGLGSDTRARTIDAIGRNLEAPLTASHQGYRSVFGSVDDQLLAYSEFEREYRLAIAKELREGINQTAARKSVLEAALSEDAPINLQLISSTKARDQLREIFNTRVLKTRELITNAGLPGLYTPSTNPARVTSRYIVSTAEGYEPMLDILQGATFSIDPNAAVGKNTTPSQSFRIGMSNLPATKTLRANVERGGRLTLDDLPDGTVVNFSDLETDDVTNSSLMRSQGSEKYKVSRGSLDGVSLRRVPGYGQEPTVSIITPSLKGLPSTDPRDLNRIADFATGTIAREAGDASNIHRVFDVTTESGRQEAADHFIKQLKRYNADGEIHAGYNSLAFDIPKYAQTLRSIPEFMDAGGDALLKQFESKTATGAAIDVLGLVREHLANQTAATISSATVSVEQKAAIATQGLMSPQALHRTRVAGEAVSINSLENIIESTNFTKLLAEGTADERELLEILGTSQAAHTSVVDTRVTGAVLRNLKQITRNDSMDGVDLTGLSPESALLVKRAIRNIPASRAITMTTNLADVRTLTSSVFDNLMETNALRGVELDIADFGTEFADPALSGLSGTIKFDPKARSFRLFSGPEALPQDLPAGFDAPAYIKRVLQRERALPASAILPNAQAQVISTGISPIRAGNIEMTNALIRGTTAVPLIDAVTPVINDANEAQFIAGMTATRTNIGYPNMPDTGLIDTSITGLMRGRLDAIGLDVGQAYMKSVYDAGIGSASINPEIRSAFVTLSELSSAQGARNKPLIAQALGVAVDDARVSILSDRLSDTMKFFGDTGIFHAGTQKRLVANESVLLLPSSVLPKIQTLNARGQRVSMLDESVIGLKSHSVRLSVATRRIEELNPTVNLVLGGEVVRGTGALEKRRALVEAESIFDTLSEQFKTIKTPKAMVEAGLAETEDQALGLLVQFGEEQRKTTIESLSQTIQRSGIGFGSILPEEGSQSIADVINTVAEGVDSDTVASQKGFQYSIANISEEGVTLAPKVSDDALREARRLGTSVGEDLVTRSTATSQLGLLQAGIRRANEEPKFLDRLKTAYEGAGSGRNQDLLERLKVIKPRVYKSVGAVAALSAGYYLATRKAKSDPIDEVMEQQPLEQEGPMSISDFNRVDQAMARQTSSRRDPLVTAGVVGNLDRNKIGHTQMGANKYNHLYGA